jgi:hypothetical protein
MMVGYDVDSDHGGSAAAAIALEAVRAPCKALRLSAVTLRGTDAV